MFGKHFTLHHENLGSCCHCLRRFSVCQDGISESIESEATGLLFGFENYSMWRVEMSSVSNSKSGCLFVFLLVGGAIPYLSS